MKTLLNHLEGLAQVPDAEKPALVVQGGGLRGVYSVAGLAVLEELGLRDAFSVVVGSSAGAINGAYFLARQAAEGIEIYVQDLSNRSFVSLMRPRKIVDIDYMVDPVLKHKHTLDVDTLISAPAPLLSVLTDAETAEPFVISSHDNDFDTYEVIRATAALPALYNRQVRLGERTYVDGGIAANVPLAQARAWGAKEALVVLTRGVTFRRRERSPLYRTVGRWAARHHASSLVAMIGAADEQYNEVMDGIEAEAFAGDSRTTFSVWPSDLRALVSGTDTNREHLRACAEMGKSDMRRFLNETPYPN